MKPIAPGLASEFGPGRQGAQYYLCVTGEGNPELRPVAVRWVRAAPAADGAWEYYPARPPTPADALEGVLQLPGRFRARQLRLAEARLDVRIDQDRQLIDVGVYHPMLRKLPERTRATPAFGAPPAELPEAFNWLAKAEDDLEALLGEHGRAGRPREPC